MVAGLIACGYDPEKASHQVAKLIDLSTDLTEVLAQELSLTDEDPILVVRINEAWVAIHGQAAADIILDAIATYGMVAPNRRDAGPGHRWLFHFNKSSDINDCRVQIVADAPHAFALSPLAVAHGVVGPSTIPMAFCAIIHKLDVREDDVEESTFFYI